MASSGTIDLRHRFFFILLTAALLGILSGSRNASAESQSDILIIVNPSVQANELSAGDVRNYFLKKLVRWKGGGKVVPINATVNSRLRKEFRRRILNMNTDQETRYWQNRKIKSGQSSPPEFSSPDKTVFRIRGAIGYVYRSEFREDLGQVVLVLPGKKADSFKVIAHPDVPVDSISREDLKLIFLLKLDSWPSGVEIKPVDLISSSDTRVHFTKIVHRKTVSALKTYWKREMFYGRSVPPPTKLSDEHVVEYVRSHPGAVGYISSTSEHNGVKVIEIK